MSDWGIVAVMQAGAFGLSASFVLIMVARDVLLGAAGAAAAAKQAKADDDADADDDANRE
jgi:hypothetical protein